MTASDKPNSQIIKEAAEWAEQFDHGELSAVQRRALVDWLLKSPVHMNELLLATSIFQAFDHVEMDSEITIEDLLARSGSEVIPLETASQFAEQPHSERQGKDAARQSTTFWRRGRMVAVAVTLVATLTIGLFTGLLYRPGDYATATGEQRSVPLADGSIMHLNAESHVRVRFNDARREVDLLAGEAMFEVAHEAERPFRVYTDNVAIEAVGTVFNVYRQDNHTTIAVIEGKVAVETEGKSITKQAKRRQLPGESRFDKNADSAERPLMLVAGEHAEVRKDGGIESARIANMETITAWRLRNLVFEGAPLSAIVREYNRYNKLQLYIDDPELATTRLSGVFNADDPYSLIKLLEVSAAVNAEPSGNNEIHLRRKDSQEK